jgi:hypothetical protein
MALISGRVRRRPSKRLMPKPAKPQLPKIAIFHSLPSALTLCAPSRFQSRTRKTSAAVVKRIAVSQ